MKSWRIFKHAWNLTVNNRSSAQKIVAPFIVITLLLQGIMIVYAETDALNTTVWTVMAVTTALIGFIAFLWIAVAWHRFILMEEHPKSIPVFHGRRMVSYFFHGFLVGFIGLMIFIPLLLAHGIFAGTSLGFWFSFVMWLVATVVLTTIMMRLLTLLPGTAVGAPITLRETVEMTKGENTVFFGLAVILFLFSLPFRIVSLLLNDAPVLFFALWDTLSGFVVLIVTLSTLTTLYGHYIEKRPLVS